MSNASITGAEPVVLLKMDIPPPPNLATPFRILKIISNLVLKNAPPTPPPLSRSNNNTGTNFREEKGDQWEDWSNKRKN